VTNLLIIVGSLTVAKLMDMAGGLTNLLKMSPCSISLMDPHKKGFGGFSSTTGMPHAGTVFYSEIIQDCLPVKITFLHNNLNSFVLCLGSSSSF